MNGSDLLAAHLRRHPDDTQARAAYHAQTWVPETPVRDREREREMTSDLADLLRHREGQL